MSADTFDPVQFYMSYPSKVIGRPGYPARAAFKSALMFELYGRVLFRDIKEIATYADIGGCFGFGANAMAFHIAKRQGTLPRTMVFEISSEFVNIGRLLFPHIEFVESEFGQWGGDVERFDLVSVFDLVEHVVDPESLLRHVSARAKFVMLKTPLETAGEWRSYRPPAKQGAEHEDGHINFFTPQTYEKLLTSSNLDIIESRLIKTFVPFGARMVLCPEYAKPAPLWSTLKRPKSFVWRMVRDFPGVPWKWKRKILGGGDHICLCRSRDFRG